MSTKPPTNIKVVFGAMTVGQAGECIVAYVLSPLTTPILIANL